MEPLPAEQLVAPPQGEGQMDQEAAMWLANGTPTGRNYIPGVGTTDASPSPLARIHVQRLDDHGEVG